MTDASHDGRGASSKDKSSTSCQSSLSMHGDAPSPMMAPPQMMYYPPGMGYPQPMPHQGYPPGYLPYPNEYPQAHAYNYPAGPYMNSPQPTYYKGDGGKAFARCFIMCCCVLFTCFFAAALVMALVLHPQLPVYSINSLSISNLNTTPPNASGDWNTIFSVENINAKLQGFISDFKVDLIHKDIILAFSTVPEFTLNNNEIKQLYGNPVSNGFTIQQWDLEDMEKEKGTGSIDFSIRITSMVAFRSNSMSTRKSLVVAFCNNLKVVFQNNTGNGTLDNGGKPVNCHIFT